MRTNITVPLNDSKLSDDFVQNLIEKYIPITAEDVLIEIIEDWDSNLNKRISLLEISWI